MKSYIIIFLLLIISLVTVKAQQIVISGFVYDAHTREKIIGATVIAGNKAATQTNEYGFYNLKLKTEAGKKIKLQVFAVGYKPQSMEIIPDKKNRADFYLKPSTIIDTVVVNANVSQLHETNLGLVTLPITELKIMPVLGAEPDIMKSMRLLPGVQSGNETNSNLYIRGGNADENLIILDGVPLYYVNHLGGFLSIFNADALSDVKLYKGGFPARYGQRLSSVIDINMKEGDMKKSHKKFSLGLLGTKFLLEGPVKVDTSSYLISFRILPLSWITKPFMALVNEGIGGGYNFYDFNAKINYKINQRNRLFLSIYAGDDNLSVSSLWSTDNYNINSRLTWGNKLVSMRWYSVLSNNVFFNLIASYTKFRYLNDFKANIPEEQRKINFQFNTGIDDFSLQNRLDLLINSYWRVKLGLQATYHIYNPGFYYIKIKEHDTISSDITDATRQYYALEGNVFVENHLNIGEFFNANLGLRATFYNIDVKTYHYLEPRVVLNFLPTKKLSSRFSYSLMHQFVHLLSSNAIDLTPDIWVPAINKIQPAEAKQYSAGFYYSVSDGLLLSLIGYKKNSNHLIAYKQGAVFNGNAQNWLDKIVIDGTGKSYGLEFMIQKNTGKTTGWFAYTYSVAERQFKELNNGYPFPFKYDRRHEIDIVVNRRINNHLTFSGTWIFGTGYPITVPVGYYYGPYEGPNGYGFDQLLLVYSDKNQYRMRPYHRLDLAINYERKNKKGYKVRWTLSVYNVYNRHNPIYYQVEQGTDGKVHLYEISLFPIIPAVAYNIEF